MERDKSNKTNSSEDKMIRLFETRIKKNLTQTDIGKLCGLSRQAYARYENGESIIDIRTLKTLAEILDVNPAYLAGYTDHKIDPKKEIYDRELTPDEKNEWIDKYKKEFDYSISIETRRIKNIYTRIPINIPINSLKADLIWTETSMQIDSREEEEGHETFFLRYDEDNMYPFIKKADIVFCKTNIEPMDKEFVIVHIGNNDATIRQVKKINDLTFLDEPQINSSLIELNDDIKIVGVVVRTHTIYRDILQPKSF